MTDGLERSYKIEGKSTNLRVWYSKGRFYARIDVYKQSSVPLSLESFEQYTSGGNDTVRQLTDFKFGQEVTEADIMTIAAITDNLTLRDCREW